MYNLLLTIRSILLLLWALGFVSSCTMSGFGHVALLIGLILVVASARQQTSQAQLIGA
jgi:hypothetical protein